MALSPGKLYCWRAVDMFRRKPADGSLLAEARRRKLQRDEEQERERVRNAEELAPLYFELEEVLAPLRVAGFAERALPACGWLAETQYCWYVDGQNGRKARHQLLSQRSVRQPQLAFDAGNGIVLALEQGSGRVSRFYRGAHGIVEPYGVVNRLEELATRPAIKPQRNASVLVSRAEAYVLFSGALQVASADRDALADRMRIAIAAAHRWCGELDSRGIYEPGDVVQTGGALALLLAFDDNHSPEWVQLYDSHHTVRADANWAPS
jgi:hypothetical protein